MRFPVGTGTAENFEKDWYVADFFGNPRQGYIHNGYDLNKKTGGNTDMGFPLHTIYRGKLVYYHYKGHPTRNYGRHNVVMIEGPWGKRWVHLAHNNVIGFLASRRDVGDNEIIARIGNSGTDWAHCHWSIFKVDPATLRNGIDTVAKTMAELNKWWEDPIAFVDKWYNYDGTTTPDMPLSEDIRLKILDEEGIITEGDLRAVVGEHNSYNQLQEDKRNADRETERLRDEYKSLKEDYERDTKTDATRVKEETKQYSEDISAIAKEAGSGQTRPEIVAEIKRLKLEADLSDKRGREAKKCKEQLDDTKLDLKAQEDAVKSLTEDIKQREIEVGQLQIKLDKMPVRKVVSPRFSLNRQDGLKILRGAALSGLTAIALYFADIIGQVDLGDNWYAPLVVALIPVLVNVLRKWGSVNIYN